MDENTEKDDQKKFLEKNQADTAGKAGEKILKLLGTSDNLFLLSDKPEDMEKNNIAYQKLLADILEIFTECKVGITNYHFVWGGIRSIIMALEQHMDNHVIGLKKELMSRSVGIKNPLSGKYDIDHATHEDIIQSVLRVRDSQGNNPEDYFFIENKGEEGTVSPIQREDIKS